MKQFRILFIGLPEDSFSKAVLGACLQSTQVISILAAWKADGVRQSRTQTVAGIEWTPWLGDQKSLVERIVLEDIDLVVTAGCSYILLTELLAAPAIGCLNVHPSLLPKFRGSAPLFWQYQQGDLNCGVTIHWMDEGIDSGAIIDQEGFCLTLGCPLKDALPMYEKAATNVTMSGLKIVTKSKHTTSNNDNRKLNLKYWKTPQIEDYKIDWNSWSIDRIIHFLSMRPDILTRALETSTSIPYKVIEQLKARNFKLPQSLP